MATQTGLKLNAYEVFLKTIHVIDTFISGGAFAQSDDRQDTRTGDMKQLGRAVSPASLTQKPIGDPGEVLYQVIDS